MRPDQSSNSSYAVSRSASRIAQRRPRPAQRLSSVSEIARLLLMAHLLLDKGGQRRHVGEVLGLQHPVVDGEAELLLDLVDEAQDVERVESDPVAQQRRMCMDLGGRSAVDAALDQLGEPLEQGGVAEARRGLPGSGRRVAATADDTPRIPGHDDVVRHRFRHDGVRAHPHVAADPDPAEQLGAGGGVQAVADLRPVAAAMHLADHYAVNQAAVVSQDGFGADHDAVRVVDDQSLPDASPVRNLRAGERRAEIVDDERHGRHAVQVEPAAHTIENHAVQPRMEQHDAELRQQAVLLPRQRLYIRMEVFEHYRSGAASVWMPRARVARSSAAMVITRRAFSLQVRRRSLSVARAAAARRSRNAVSRASRSTARAMAGRSPGANSNALWPSFSSSRTLGCAGATIAQPQAMYSNSFNGEA